ncbi:beta-ketoacyl-[acyl-carrier-protein] synthase family protein [Actinokineospora sp. 24-640]
MRATAAITGIGLVTPVGRKPDDVFDALRTGRTGLSAPPEGHPLAGVLAAAGIAPDIAASEVLPAREARGVDRFVLLAMAAADDAIADARLTTADADPERVAVVVSTGGAGLETYENHAAARRGGKQVSPYLLPGMLANMAAARIAIKHGFRGYSSCIATACAAGAQSIAEAVRLIRAGEADVVVCGGSDTALHPTVAGAFANAWALARGFADPAAASRPFDAGRNGFVLGEGAGVFVVERTAHADARGVPAYAELLGWGVTTDAHHPTTPRPDGSGAAAVMRRAIADGGLVPSDVDYVNAHGTSTKLGDAAEATAIRAVFGADGGPAVSSIKALTGHMLGASGAVEAAATALSVATGVLPPTHNLDDPDPGCALDHVRGGARATTVRAALTNTFAFGGHNVSLLIGPASTRLARFQHSRG